MHLPRLFRAILPLPVLHPVVLTLAVSALLVLFYNGQLWSAVLAGWPGRSLHDILFLASLGLFLIAAFNLVLQPFAFPRVLKPVLAVVIVTAAVVSYFASSYGALMDRTMIANVIETDSREMADLFSARLVADLVLFGLLPALAILFLPLSLSTWRREAAIRGGVVLCSMALVGVTAAFFFQDYASLLRNHREIRHMVNPSAAIYSAVRVATEMPVAAGGDVRRVANAVSRNPLVTVGAGGRKKLIVLVVGETARAADFSLNGYERDTNPELSRFPVVSFANVRSCGTSTAVSVPCMFYPFGQNGYSERDARATENLTDIFVRAGVGVHWLENNSGCKGVCARVPTEVMSDDAALCDGGECRDEIMLRSLRRILDTATGDTVVVMHQLGSHGPAYYKRYPAAFAAFQPVCETNQLQSCSREEIRNAYDNSIRYTDHVLAETISLLDGAAERFDTAMLYVSDHGESLGENGLYLHGLPYMIAPDAQTHVPMIFWSSRGYAREASLDTACLAEERDKAFSHDNLFHSMLGMLDVRTDLYRADLDILTPCRPGVTLAHAAPAGPAATAHP